MRELQEEIGVSLPEADLEAAWVCTLPASAEGATAQHGRFLCREYQACSSPWLFSVALLRGRSSVRRGAASRLQLFG